MDNVFILLGLLVDLFVMVLSTIFQTFMLMGGLAVAFLVLGLAIPKFGTLFLISLLAIVVYSFTQLVVALIMGVGGDE